MVIGSIGGDSVALGPPILSSIIVRPRYYSIICLVKQIFVQSYLKWRIKVLVDAERWLVVGKNFGGTYPVGFPFRVLAKIVIGHLSLRSFMVWILYNHVSNHGVDIV